MKKKKINTYMQYLEYYVPCFCKHNGEVIILMIDFIFKIFCYYYFIKKIKHS